MNYVRLEKIYSDIVSDMPEEQVDFLHFVAYKAYGISEPDIRKYAQINELNPNTVRQWKRRLEGMGLIKYIPSDGWNYIDAFNPRYFFPFAFHLLRHESKRLYDFERYGLTLRNKHEFLWNKVYQIADGNSATIDDDQTWPQGQAPQYLLHVCFEEEFKEHIFRLSNGEFNELLNSKLEYMLNTLSGSAEDFERLDELVREYYSGGLFGLTPAADLLLDKIGLFRYFYDGTTPKEESPTYLYTAYEAIRELYHGNILTCLERFEKSLKSRNKYNNDKNLYYNQLLNYFLILAYKKADTDETRTKVRQFLNKKIVKEDLSFSNIEKIAKYIGEAVDDKEISHYLEWGLFGGNALQQVLGSILRGYFGLSTDIEVPSYAILKHEFSPFIEVPDEFELEGIYGGTPVISSIPRQEKWMVMLKELEASIDKTGKANTDSPADRKTERIGYIYDGHGLEPRLQTRLKNGNWGAGKRVSDYDFYQEKAQCMDDADRKIARNARSSRYYRDIEPHLAFPHLIGTDKVLFGRYAPYKQVEIIEEKPYLTIKETKTGYKISSNVFEGLASPLAPLEHKCRINRISDTKCSVIKLSDVQVNLLKPFASLIHLPHTAKDVISRLVPKLADHIEIHSNLIEGGSSLEQREGNSAIILQISPEKDEYDVKVLVRPLEGGSVEFFPGEGDKIIYDEASGVRYQVNRDLKAENNALKELEGLMQTFFEGDVDNYESYLVYPSEMLEIVEWASERKDRFNLEWPQGKKINVFAKPQSGNINVSITSGEQWFEVEGEIKYGGGDTINISDILELISSGALRGNYIRLNDEDYLALGDSLRKQLKRLESLSESDRNGTHVSVYNVGALAEIVRSSQINISTDDGLEVLSQKIREAQTLEPTVPQGLHAALRDYQYEGFRWMVRLDHWGAGACLADDMGLGKTIQTIAFMLYKASAGPSLVIAPASVLLNWEKELHRFAPELKVNVLNHCDNRTATIEAASAGDIVLTTYGILSQEDETLLNKKWNVVCLDEAHTIKNRQTKMSASAMKLNASSRVILTGTPIQNYLGELWNLFQFLNPGLLGKFEIFSRKFIGNSDADLNGLKKMVQPFILRRTKAQVLDELPEKTEIIRPIELSDLEMASYENMRDSVLTSLEGESKVSVNALAAITRLRQAACSMSLVNDKWPFPSSKVTACMELLENILSGGNRVLIFSQFTSFLSIMAAQLDKAGIEYHYLDGSTPIKKRDKMVQEFQNGIKQIFIVSLKAGGLGLNLTGANYVIHLDPWWNPAIEQQATDRAHRIGQKQNVTVYHLISQHTIEEKILRLHERKRDLADTFLEGAGLGRAMTIEDLRELVNL